MAQSDDGLTNAEHGALAWIAVKEKFERTDKGCKCSPCDMIRMQISVENERMGRQTRSGTDAERRLRNGRY